MVAKGIKTSWYKEWFNSPFYHILYKNRDETEAKKFISNLIDFLQPSPNYQLLDVACGKGRHSIYLNQLGFNVDAFDLSEESISYAKQFENEKLHFYVNDIRKPLKKEAYNVAFNLFTSFGYFDDENDNIKSIQAIGDSLKPGGLLVLDFLNAYKTIANLVPSETKEVDNIAFYISREVKDGFIYKNISFSHDNNSYTFTEQVKGLYLEHFENYFSQAGLRLKNTFGDYLLSPFEKTSSNRLILVAQKNDA